MFNLSTYFWKTFEIKEICSKTEQNVCRLCHENYNPRVHRKLLFEKFWKKQKNLFWPCAKQSLLVLSYLRSTYPEEQFDHFFSKKSFKDLSVLRNADLKNFPFSSKNRKRRVLREVCCKFFGIFHKTLTFSGGWATFLKDVVRVLFQGTKKNLWDSFSWTIPKNSYLSRLHWAKEFCTFPYQLLNYQEEHFEQSFLKIS